MYTLEAVLRTIAARQGFLTDKTIEMLAKKDRLRQVVVRCGGCRFVCAAQDARHLIALVESGKDASGYGDYVRDVSMSAGDPIYRNDFATKITKDPPEPREHRRLGNGPEKTPIVTNYANRTHPYGFAEHDCGGAFDGVSVMSDADPGL
jgi:hypothetical protein